MRFAGLCQGCIQMEIYYKNCRCRYGTYRVGGEEKPVFYLLDNPTDVSIYEAGFEEVHYGLWCHFLDNEEIEKMNRYIKKLDKSKR